MNATRRSRPALPAALAAAALAAAALLAAVAAGAAPAAQPAAQTAARPATTPAPAAAPGAGAALIHATVTLRDGAAHAGFVRWRDEDAFWDDTFAAWQVASPWLAYADHEALQREQRQQYYQSHGLLNRLAWALHHQDDRAGFRRRFVCRYGDLVALRQAGDARQDADPNAKSDQDRGRDKDEDDDGPTVAVLKDGREVALEGASRDLGSDLLIYADTGGDEPVELEWDEVREIRFGPAPVDAKPYAQRLAGTVAFAGGSFSGPVQWDLSECTSVDKLDGDDEHLPMADVRRIARNRRGGSDVTLADGRTLALTGTNDVGEGNRGAAVLVAGLGRVVVPWSRLVAVDLQPAPPTAPAYGDFPAPRPLRGTVAAADGRTLTGRLVYDLDEATTADIMHGTLDERDYAIPFALVAAIVPGPPGACEVTLRDGRRLLLSGDEDTGQDHAGVLVFADGREKPDYVPWRGVRRLDFTP